MDARRSVYRLAFVVVLLVLLISVGKATANSINIFGLDHTSLGNATLQMSENALSITNIGPVGPPGIIPADGVRVSLPPNLVRWAAQLAPLGDTNTTPFGATFTQTTRGIVGGVPNQTLSVVDEVHVRDGGSDTIDIRSRFPIADNLPGATVTAQYSNAGRTVLTEHEIDPRDAIWSGSRFADDTTITAKCECCPVKCSIEASKSFPVATRLFTPFENTPLTDVLLVTLDPGPNIVDLAYTDVSLTAAGFTSFAITNETLEVVPEPTTLLLFGTTMAGLGLAARRRRRRQG